MSSTAGNDDGEPLRKRVRKGTRSCWECKRRKVRCQLSAEDVPVCSGCLARGTACLSQEYPEERSDTSSGVQIGERLGRVEKLLETLVEKISAYEEEENAQKILTPESLGNDVLTPFPANVASNDIQESASLFSVFDNAVINHQENNQAQDKTPASLGTAPKTPSCRTPKAERVRQALVELLPSQQDTDLIISESISWLLVYSSNSSFAKSVATSRFDVGEISKKPTIAVARSLLYFAVCLQQLDAGFDTSRLHLYPSLEARMEKYLSTVQALVTSDDALVSTIDGLECLVLQGMYHVNAGNPRRAWLSFRRAMNIAQLMGIHNNSSTSIPREKEMWYAIVHADRYLGLLLGLPAGSADDAFRTDETFQNPEMNKYQLFSRKLCVISTRIIERNQAENTLAYAATQEIDEMLDNLAKEMGAEWWDIPAYIMTGRSRAKAILFEQLMTQIWYYQLEALLHLPFMLRATTERRFEYSKFSCLKASREVILRYLALRTTDSRSFCCKVIDFGALTATVTLFLGLLAPESTTESSEKSQQRDSDRKKIKEVLELMEELSQGGKDVVSTQCVNVINSLMAVDSPSERNSGNLKLSIPYFGTVNIIRPPQPPANPASADAPYTQQMQAADLQQPQTQQQLQMQQPVTVGQQLPDSQGWQDLSYSSSTAQKQNPPYVPLVSFTSSQFPPIMPEQPIQDWGLPEDTLFFDSLLNTDIEGNWVY